jgi:hypothetical protein
MEEVAGIHEKLLAVLEKSGLPFRQLEHEAAETSAQSGTSLFVFFSFPF